MIKEVISNAFAINVNKQSGTPPTTQTKEAVSNTFNLIINKRSDCVAKLNEQE